MIGSNMAVRSHFPSLAPLMKPDSVELPLKVRSHISSIPDWVERGHTIPSVAVPTAAESYVPQSGEHAPSSMMVANEVSITPMNVGQMTGHCLRADGMFQGENTSHEDSSLIPELYLLSFDGCCGSW